MMAMRHVQSNHLSYEQAAAIREAYGTGGCTQQQLADAYGVTQTAISQIVRYVHHAVAPVVPPPRPAPVQLIPPIERWTAEMNAAPSPWTDAVLARVIADIRATERRLGLPPAPLP